MKIVWLIVSVIFIFIAIFLGYYGAFTPIHVQKESKDQIFFVKKTVTGDYAQTAKVQSDFFVALQEDLILSTKGIGIYYDNPKDVAIDDLRSDVGCVVLKTDTAKISTLFKYELAKLGAGDYIVAEFPFRGSLSVFFGVFRVYPKLTAFAEKNGLTLGYAVEICDVPNEMTYYMMRIAE